MKKLVFVSLAAVMASFAASADTVVTSKTYVDTKMQSKMATGDANSIPVYTGSLSDTNAPTFSPRAIHSATSYSDSTDANKIPTMGAVMAQITGHEVQLPTGTPNSVVLYNGEGKIGAERAIATTLGTDTTATTLPTTGAVVAGLNGKQNTLTFDNTPTANSNNPVKSGGIKTYVDGKVSSATTISTTSTTTAPNEKAVSDAIGAVQTQVTTLANCKHTCTSSDPTNHSDWCDLITVTCVEAASNS